MRRPTLRSLFAALAPPPATRADRVEKQVPVTAGQQLEIHLQTGGSITIRGGGERAASITVDRRGRDSAETEVRVEPTSRGVRLSTRQVGRRRSFSTNLRIDVRVPRRFSVDLQSMGGSVHLESLEGDFRGSTNGGRLELMDLTGVVDLSTLGGDVQVTRSKLDGKVSTNGGDVRLDQVEGSVDATTLAGNVTLTMAGDPAQGSHAARLGSNAGELHLAVLPGLGMDIDIQLFYTRGSRRSYSVHSDFPLEIHESSEWDTDHGSPRKLIHATGRQGAGTHRIELRTINGNVYLTCPE